MPPEPSWFQTLLKSEPLERYLVKLGLLAVVYFIAAKIGLALALTTEQVSAIWPPTGIAMATILLLGRRYWPGVLIGAFAVNFMANEPLAVALAIASGNTLEALTGAYLIQRFIPKDQLLDKISHVVGFVILGPLLSTMVSATIGVSSLVLGGLVDRVDFGSVWVVWWVGDMIGALIIVPLIVAWGRRDYRLPIERQPLEAAALALVVLSMGLLIFSQSPSLTSPVSPLIYVVFPLLVWGAVRLTQIGAITVGTIFTAVAIWGTINNFGPFALGGQTEKNLILLHFFIVTIMVTGLVLSVAVAQRLRSEAALKQQTEELELAKQNIVHGDKWRQDLEGQVKDATQKLTDILGGIFEEPKK